MKFFRKQNEHSQGGYSLLELIATLTVMTVLIMGTLPLVQNAVKRRKEVKLRQTLAQIRDAIDAFKRDTVGACPLGAVRSGNPANRGGNIPPDPRSRVVIDDCTIFDTENLDRYPPSLDTLVDGVKVKPRGLPAQATSGSVFGDTNATELGDDASKEVIKRYLAKLPVDPVTGKDDTWKFRSSYQGADEETWDEVNIFDVRSGSELEALNGESYSDW